MQLAGDLKIVRQGLLDAVGQAPAPAVGHLNAAAEALAGAVDHLVTMGAGSQLDPFLAHARNELSGLERVCAK